MAVMRLPGPSLRILYAYSGVARPLSTGAGRRLRGRAGPAREARDQEVGMSGRDDAAAALAAAGAYRRLAEQALLDRPLARDEARALLVSLGIMEEGQARTLGEAGVDFVNHNLNTSRRFYPAICSTHTYDDRMATVRGSSRAGLGACSGVIIGMGETHEDLIDVAGE